MSFLSIRYFSSSKMKLRILVVALILAVALGVESSVGE